MAKVAEVQAKINITGADNAKTIADNIARINTNLRSLDNLTKHKTYKIQLEVDNNFDPDEIAGKIKNIESELQKNGLSLNIDYDLEGLNKLAGKVSKIDIVPKELKNKVKEEVDAINKEFENLKPPISFKANTYEEFSDGLSQIENDIKIRTKALTKFKNTKKDISEAAKNYARYFSKGFSDAFSVLNKEGSAKDILSDYFAGYDVNKYSASAQGALKDVSRYIEELNYLSKQSKLFKTTGDTWSLDSLYDSLIKISPEFKNLKNTFDTFNNLEFFDGRKALSLKNMVNALSKVSEKETFSDVFKSLQPENFDVGLGKGIQYVENYIKRAKELSTVLHGVYENNPNGMLDYEEVMKRLTRDGKIKIDVVPANLDSLVARITEAVTKEPIPVEFIPSPESVENLFDGLYNVNVNPVLAKDFVLKIDNAELGNLVLADDAFSDVELNNAFRVGFNLSKNATSPESVQQQIRDYLNQTTGDLDDYRKSILVGMIKGFEDNVYNKKKGFKDKSLQEVGGTRKVLEGAFAGFAKQQSQVVDFNYKYKDSGIFKEQAIYANDYAEALDAVNLNLKDLSLFSNDLDRNIDIFGNVNPSIEAAEAKIEKLNASYEKLQTRIQNLIEKHDPVSSYSQLLTNRVFEFNNSDQFKDINPLNAIFTFDDEKLKGFSSTLSKLYTPLKKLFENNIPEEVKNSFANNKVLDNLLSGVEIPNLDATASNWDKLEAIYNRMSTLLDSKVFSNTSNSKFANTAPIKKWIDMLTQTSQIQDNLNYAEAYTFNKQKDIGAEVEEGQRVPVILVPDTKQIDSKLKEIENAPRTISFNADESIASVSKKIDEMFTDTGRAKKLEEDIVAKQKVVEDLERQLVEAEEKFSRLNTSDAEAQNLKSSLFTDITNIKKRMSDADPYGNVFKNISNKIKSSFEELQNSDQFNLSSLFTFDLSDLQPAINKEVDTLYSALGRLFENIPYDKHPLTVESIAKSLPDITSGYEFVFEEIVNDESLNEIEKKVAAYERVFNRLKEIVNWDGRETKVPKIAPLSKTMQVAVNAEDGLVEKEAEYNKALTQYEETSKECEAAIERVHQLKSQLNKEQSDLEALMANGVDGGSHEHNIPIDVTLIPDMALVNDEIANIEKTDYTLSFNADRSIKDISDKIDGIFYESNKVAKRKSDIERQQYWADIHQGDVDSLSKESAEQAAEIEKLKAQLESIAGQYTKYSWMKFKVSEANFDLRNLGERVDIELENLMDTDVFSDTWDLNSLFELDTSKFQGIVKEINAVYQALARFYENIPYKKYPTAASYVTQGLTNPDILFSGNIFKDLKGYGDEHFILSAYERVYERVKEIMADLNQDLDIKPLPNSIQKAISEEEGMADLENKVSWLRGNLKDAERLYDNAKDREGKARELLARDKDNLEKLKSDASGDSKARELPIKLKPITDEIDIWKSGLEESGIHVKLDANDSISKIKTDLEMIENADRKISIGISDESIRNLERIENVLGKRTDGGQVDTGQTDIDNKRSEIDNIEKQIAETRKKLGDPKNALAKIAYDIAQSIEDFEETGVFEELVEEGYDMYNFDSSIIEKVAGKEAEEAYRALGTFFENIPEDKSSIVLDGLVDAMDGLFGLEDPIEAGEILYDYYEHLLKPYFEYSGQRPPRIEPLSEDDQRALSTEPITSGDIDEIKAIKDRLIVLEEDLENKNAELDALLAGGEAGLKADSQINENIVTDQNTTRELERQLANVQKEYEQVSERIAEASNLEENAKAELESSTDVRESDSNGIAITFTSNIEDIETKVNALKDTQIPLDFTDNNKIQNIVDKINALKNTSINFVDDESIDRLADKIESLYDRAGVEAANNYKDMISSDKGLSSGLGLEDAKQNFETLTNLSSQFSTNINRTFESFSSASPIKKATESLQKGFSGLEKLNVFKEDGLGKIFSLGEGDQVKSLNRIYKPLQLLLDEAIPADFKERVADSFSSALDAFNTPAFDGVESNLEKLQILKAKLDELAGTAFTPLKAFDTAFFGELNFDGIDEAVSELGVTEEKIEVVSDYIDKLNADNANGGNRTIDMIINIDIAKASENIASLDSQVQSLRKNVEAGLPSSDISKTMDSISESYERYAGSVGKFAENINTPIKDMTQNVKELALSLEKLDKFSDALNKYKEATDVKKTTEAAVKSASPSKGILDKAKEIEEYKSVSLKKTGSSFGMFGNEKEMETLYAKASIKKSTYEALIDKGALSAAKQYADDYSEIIATIHKLAKDTWNLTENKSGKFLPVDEKDVGNIKVVNDALLDYYENAEGISKVRLFEDGKVLFEDNGKIKEATANVVTFTDKLGILHRQVRMIEKDASVDSFSPSEKILGYAKEIEEYRHASFDKTGSSFGMFGNEKELESLYEQASNKKALYESLIDKGELEDAKKVAEEYSDLIVSIRESAKVNWNLVDNKSGTLLPVDEKDVNNIEVVNNALLEYYRNAEGVSKVNLSGNRSVIFEDDGKLKEATAKIVDYTDKLGLLHKQIRVIEKNTSFNIALPKNLNDMSNRVEKFMSLYGEGEEKSSYPEFVGGDKYLKAINKYVKANKDVEESYDNLDREKFEEAQAERIAYLKQVNDIITNEKYFVNNSKGVYIGDAEQLDSVKKQREALAEYAKESLNAKKILENNGASISFKDAEGTVVTLKAKYEEFNDVLGNTVRQFRAVVASNPSSVWAKMSGSLFNITKQFTTIYLTTYRVFGYIRRAFSSAISFVTNLDSQLTTINQTMSVTQSELQDLGSSSVAMAKDLGSTVDTVLGAVALYANANESAQSVLQKANPTVMLANASGDSISSVADQIQGVVNQFDDMAGKEYEVVNAYEKISANLAMDFKSGITTVSEGVTAAGSLADEAGLKFQLFGSIVGKIAETTRLSGSQIGTAMKTMMARISRSQSADEDVSDEDRSNASEAFSSLGISLYDSNGQLNDLESTLDALSQKWDAMTDAEKAYISEQAAGVRGLNVFRAMMDNYAESKQIAADIDLDKDFANEVQEKHLDSLQAHINSLKAAVQELYDSVINTEGMKQIVDLAKIFVEAFTGIVRAFSDVGGIFGSLGAEIGALIPVVSMLGSLMIPAFALKNAQSWSDFFNSMKVQLSGIVKLFEKIKAANILGALSDGVADEASEEIAKGVAKGTGEALPKGWLKYATKGLKESGTEIADEAADVGKEIAEGVAKGTGEIAVKDLTVSTSKALEETGKEVAEKAADEAVDIGTEAAKGAIQGAGKEITEDVGDELKKGGIGSTIKGVVSSIPVWGKVAAAIAATVVALGTLSKHIESSRIEGYSKAVDKAAESYNKAQEKMDSYNAKLEENEARIAELNKQPTLTLQDKNELSNLQKANQILKERIELQQRSLSLEAQTLANSSYEKVSNLYTMEAPRTYTYHEAGTYDSDRTGSTVNDTANGYMYGGTKYGKRAIVAEVQAYLDDIQKLNEGFDEEVQADMETREQRLIDWSSDIHEQLENQKAAYQDAIEVSETQRTAAQNDAISQYLETLKMYNTISKSLDADSFWNNQFTNLQADSSTSTIFDKLLDSVEKFNSEKDFFKFASEQKGFASLSKAADNAGLSIEELVGRIYKSGQTIEEWGLKIEGNSDRISQLSTLTADWASNIGKSLDAIAGDIGNANGLTQETIGYIKDLYSGLEGYDESTLFHATAAGVRVNTEELARLNKEYDKSQLEKYDNELNNLGEQYRKVSVAIGEATYGTAEYNNLIDKRDALQKQIEETEILKGQYEGLTSAYAEWTGALDSTGVGSGFDKISENLKNMKELRDKGLVGDDSFAPYLQLIASDDEIKKAEKKWGDFENWSSRNLADFFDSNIKTFNRYFKDQDKGTDNFLKDLKKKGYATLKDGIWNFDGADADIAKSLGISEDAVVQLFDKLEQYGFKIDRGEVESATSKAIKDSTKSAKDDLKEAQKEINKQLESSDRATAYEQYNNALKEYKELTGEDYDVDGKHVFGNIDLDQRNVIKWTKENAKKYKKALESWGDSEKDVIGSYSTVMGMSSSFGYTDSKGKNQEVEIAFSPILQTEKGAELLDKHTVSEYIYGLVDKATEDGELDTDKLFKLDAEGLEFNGKKIKGLVASVGDEARKVGEVMHYMGVDGEIEDSMRRYLDLVKKTGVSLKEANKADSKNKNLDYLKDNLKQIEKIDLSKLDTEKYKKSTEELEKDIGLVSDAMKEMEEHGDTDTETYKSLEKEKKALEELQATYTSATLKKSDFASVNLDDEDTIADLEESLDVLKEIEGAADELGDFTIKGIVNIEDVNSANDDIKKVEKAIKKLNKGKGKIKIGEVEGAEEANNILQALYTKKQELSNPVFMQINIGGLDNGQASVIGKIQAIQEALNTIERQEWTAKAGIEVPQEEKNAAQAQLRNAITALNNDPNTEIKTKLGLENVSVEDLSAAKAKIKESLGKIDTDALVNIGIGQNDYQNFKDQDKNETATITTKVDRTAYDKFKSENKDTSAKVKYTVEITNPETYNNLKKDINIKQNVTTKKKTVSSSRKPGVQELAQGQNQYTPAGKRILGIAHAGGKGVAKAGGVTRTLVGEEGAEIVVRNGSEWFTVGDNGAEFFDIRSDDIVFTASQTEDLLSRGFTNGRGSKRSPAFAGGQAASNNKTTISGEKVGKSNNSTKKKNSTTKNNNNNNSKKKGNTSTDTKKEKEEIDWIERKIKSIEDALSRLQSVRDNIYNSWSVRNKKLKEELSKLREEYKAQGEAATAYKKKADSVDLDKNLKKKVREGNYSIKSYSQGKAEKIQKYQEYWDKYQEARQKQKDLEVDIDETLATQFEYIQKQHELEEERLETQKELYSYTKELNATRYIGKIDEEVKNANGELTKLTKKLKDITGTPRENKITKGSEGWKELDNQIQKLKVHIAELNKEKFDTIAENYENLIKRFEEANDLLETQADGFNYMKSNDSSAYISNLTSQFNNQKTILSDLNAEQADLKKQLKDVSSGKNPAITKNSEKYREMQSTLNDVKVQAAEAKNALSELREEMFNAVIDKYETKLEAIESTISLINETMDTAEKRGLVESAKYYQSLKKETSSTISELTKERDELNNSLAAAIKSGYILAGSRTWYEMKKQIADVDESIEAANGDLAEFTQKINEIEWERFDRLQESISNFIDELEALNDLITSNGKILEENGAFNGKGFASMGLIVSQLKTYQKQVKDFTNELKVLDRQYKDDSLNSYYLERRQELLESQHEAIANVQDEKEAIKDLYEEAYQKQLDYLDELIDARKEALDVAKESYEYQKKIAELTANVTNAQRRYAAFGNDNSEEGRRNAQTARTELRNAQDELREEQWDKYIEDTEKILDDLATEAEDWVNKRLDDLDGLLADAIKTVDIHGSSIKETIETEMNKAGFTASDATNVYTSKLDNISNAVNGGVDKIVNTLREQNNKADAEIAKAASNNTSSSTNKTSGGNNSNSTSKTSSGSGSSGTSSSASKASYTTSGGTTTYNNGVKYTTPTVTTVTNAYGGSTAKKSAGTVQVIATWDSVQKSAKKELILKGTKLTGKKFSAAEISVLKAHKGEYLMYDNGNGGYYQASISTNGNLFYNSKGTVYRYNTSSGKVDIPVKYNKGDYKTLAAKGKVGTISGKNVWKDYQEALHSRGVKGYSQGGIVGSPEALLKLNGDDQFTINTLKTGESVFDVATTKVLQTFNKQAPVLADLVNFAEKISLPNMFSKTSGGETNIDNVNLAITLPNVKNYDDFKNSLISDNSFNNAMFDAINNAITGKGNSLSKNKYRR